MITVIELIRASRIGIIPPELKPNFDDFLRRINQFRKAYGKPMVPTSFYRSMSDQIAIYKDKAKKKQAPFKTGVFDLAKVPTGSCHLYCQACDFADADGKMKEWIKSNVKLLEQCGLWCEDFDATPTWAHFQTVAPKSGKRFFKP